MWPSEMTASHCIPGRGPCEKVTSARHALELGGWGWGGVQRRGSHSHWESLRLPPF